MTAKFFPSAIFSPSVLALLSIVVWGTLQTNIDPNSYETTVSVTKSARVRQPNGVVNPKSLNVEPRALEFASPVAVAVDTKTERSTNLLKNWDLKILGLRESDIEPFFEYDQPRSIVFFDGKEFTTIIPKNLASGSQQSDKTLFVGSQKSIEKTDQARRNRSTYYDSQRGTDEKSFEKSDKSDDLAANAFKIGFFNSGTRDNGHILSPVSTDLLKSLQGPDYSFSDLSYADDVAMAANLSRVISLGHGGEILIEIDPEGVLVDGPGEDFKIYENAFRIAGTDLIFQEFAYVGVSNSLDKDSFFWYECDPKMGVLFGCAGAVPTAEGGDRFDLAESGMKEVRYIWIKDYGKNKNYPSKWPTEGVDLDAVRLKNATTKK